MPNVSKRREANASLYDAALGRFLSPDPYVQNPFMTRNYNRYTYAMNNPLVYIDRDGELANWIIGVIIGAFFYAKAASDNTPKADQGNPLNWNWLPWNWEKPEKFVNTQYRIQRPFDARRTIKRGR